MAPISPKQGPGASVFAMLAEGPRSLPVLPSTAARLATLPRDEEEFRRRALRLIEGDFLAAAQVLSLAAEGWVRSGKLSCALAALEPAVLVEHLARLARGRPFRLDQPDRRSLWLHAIETAHGARALARQEGQVDPDVALVAGLLHDLGRLALLELLPARAARIEGADWVDAAGLLAAELEELGFDHARVGGRFARALGLPRVLVESIEYHHLPLGGLPRSWGVRDLVRAVSLADRVSLDLLRRPGAVERAVRDPEGFLAERWPPERRERLEASEQALAVSLSGVLEGLRRHAPWVLPPVDR